jgi:hypothetical protein
MSKKKPIKKIFESTPIESADANPESRESTQSDQQVEETTPTNPQDPEVKSASEDLDTPETSLPSEEAYAELMESVSAELQSEATPSDENTQEEIIESPSAGEETSSEIFLPSDDSNTPPMTETVENDAKSEAPGAESGAPEEPLEMPADESKASNEDLLADIRRSLIEEQSDKAQKETKWWRRIGRKAKKIAPEEPPVPVEIDLPPTPASSEVLEEQQLKNEPEEDVDQIDDLIGLLKAEKDLAVVDSSAVQEVEAPPEPEPELDFEELKKQAFRQRTESEDSEDFTDVRSVALEGGEEVLVEVDTKAPDALEERLTAFENALKPYRLYINIALAVLGVVMAVFASLIIVRVYQASRPQSVEEVSNLPYPAGVSLPGGWSFKLGKGTLQNGKWDPQGAEWLEGTEVCRWVALPWSRQLEAVVRTLNPNDPIELTMSNNDKFVYQVYSVKQLTPEEMQKLDSNSACLLLILTQPDAEKRWVLTALP